LLDGPCWVMRPLIVTLTTPADEFPTSSVFASA
jgi:hypothetical protein